MKLPLTLKILSDPNHQFVKTLIYIYSMESFVFREMNKASRKKDVTKIEYYGALAAALGLIVHHGHMDKALNHTNKTLTVYRGLKLPKEEFTDKYILGNIIQLTGFTSTTFLYDTAEKFAIEGLES